VEIPPNELAFEAGDTVFDSPRPLPFPYLYFPMNAAELILNPDGSIYHLNLLPEDVAPIVILVGDQGRVPKVSKFFNSIDVIKQKREFITHTGWIGEKRITVLSTGIGSDNIDIVLNELDELVNIDLKSRQPKENLTSLHLIRIGTSGSMHPDVHVDDILVSSATIDLPESFRRGHCRERSSRRGDGGENRYPNA
jgi:uridine phosphorylase